jgi:methylase of polypeptide subunit release factors
VVHTFRFGPLDVAYDDDVLEPRPWTLAQSEWAAQLLEVLPAGPVLELCAGAGHIGQVVAVRTGRPLVQVDTDAGACRFAEANAAAAGVTAEVRCADLASALRPDERFPLVLADPPYIPTAATGAFPQDPRLAIDGGNDGLDVARQCLVVAGDHLADGGALIIQLRDGDQADRMAYEAAGDGFPRCEIRLVHDQGALLLLRPAG